MRNLLVIVLVPALCMPLFAQTADEKIVAQNIAAGEKALKEKKLDDARLSLKAALALDPGNQQALTVLSDVFVELKRPDEALAAAVASLDTPKRRNRNAQTFAGRAIADVRVLSPTLATFLAMRTSTADALLKMCPRADKEKRQHDSEWLHFQASLIAPTDAAVEAIKPGLAPVRAHRLHGEYGLPGAETPSAPAGKATLPEGAVDLTADVTNWSWLSKSLGSKAENGEFIFAKCDSLHMSDLHLGLAKYEIKGAFTITFDLKFTRYEDFEPRVFIVLREQNRGGGSGLCLFPLGIKKKADEYDKIREPSAMYVRANGKEGWKGEVLRDIPKDAIKEKVWNRFTLKWNPTNMEVTLRCGDKNCLQEVVQTPMTGYPGFGITFVSESRLKNMVYKAD